MSSAVHQSSSLSSNLTPAQAQVAAALAQGHTVTAAAAAAGIHRTTIHHWLRTCPAFKTATSQARIEYQAILADLMTELAAKAVAALGQLLDDPATPPSVRLRTSLAILQRPVYPSPPWNLPVPLENPRQQEIITELQCMEVESKHLQAIHLARRADPSPAPATRKPDQHRGENQPAAPRIAPVTPAISSPPQGVADQVKECG